MHATSRFHRRSCRIALFAAASTLLPSVARAEVAPVSADGTASSDERVAIRITYVAPPACAGSAAFEAQVRARTSRFRAAVGHEPARIFHVEILEDLGAVVGRMVAERDGERSGARVLRGQTCSEVSSALALSVALSIDPTARLVVGPVLEAPAVSPPAPGEPSKPQSPATPAPPTSAPLPVQARLGVAAGVARIVKPDLMPVVSVFGALASSRASALSPAVIVSVDVASNELDAGREATFRWAAAGLELCPLRAPVGAIVELRPCVEAQAGLLDGRGRAVAAPVDQSRAWWSTGFTVHAAVRLSRRLGVDLSGAARLPLRGKDFVFDDPRVTVAQTPAVSVAVGLGLFLVL